MSKKRLIAMLMAGAMTLGVATGCGNTATNDSQNSDAGTDSTDGAYKIALIQQARPMHSRLQYPKQPRQRPRRWALT